MAKRTPSVLFNASVILAGFKSPTGGSAKVISWVEEGKIKGVISEVILDEILRNAQKISFDRMKLNKKIEKNFKIRTAPKQETVDQFKSIVLNFGDAHVLASCQESKADFLVTLDRKHLLVLKNQIKKFKIFTPGQLIEILS
ncbi:putative toxin-antitoxin system toxin component, PIN family [Candidatus Daviesbacteria bacterium]|nr:putative toxin-antitoxin system toxin component, PIN family [Candidatus Daviesbacteria bacterium]